MAASEAASEGEATAAQGTSSTSGHVVRAVYVNTSNEPHDDEEAERMYCEAAKRALENGDLAVLADIHFNVGNVRQRLGARQTAEVLDKQFFLLFFNRMARLCRRRAFNSAETRRLRSGASLRSMRNPHAAF
jgi:hypothetical protein